MRYRLWDVANRPVGPIRAVAGRHGRPSRLRLAGVLAVTGAVLLAGCSRPAGGPPVVAAPSSSAAKAAPVVAPPSPATSAAPGSYSKVLLIALSSRGPAQIIGNRDAPYLNGLAETYGSAVDLAAGYPATCPTAAAYILLTSGSTGDVCDGRGAATRPLRGDSLFQQVAVSGREWRNYTEGAPGPCARQDSSDGRYLVRHVPATYYVDERSNCARWAVPLGTPQAGALHDDIAAGALPAFGFVSPDACHAMHGARPCRKDLVAEGDRWLRTWMTQLLAGPDYRAGRLVVIITWDKGTGTDNHVPTLVVSPTTDRIVADQPFTHCSTLRTVEELLRLPLLGCAAEADSMVTAFRL